MMGNVLGMKYGQEQITKNKYYDFNVGSIDPFKTLKIDEFKNINRPITFRTQSTILMATDTNALPVVLNGYNLDSELKNSRLNSVITKEFKFKAPFPLILGKRLAQSLTVEVGAEIAVIGQAIDGSVANEIFVVEKILDLGGGEFEKTFAMTDLKSMQNFLGLDSGSAHILVNFGDPIKSSDLPPDYEKVEWKKLLPEIASSSGFMQRFTRFYAIFFALVASLAMINTVSLSFLERTQEFKTSIVIGSPNSWLRMTMGLEIFCISVLSLMLGNILILIAIWIFTIFPLNLSLLTGGEPLQMGGMVMTQNVALSLELWIFIAVNGFFIVTQFLASTYPMSVVLKKSQGNF